MTATGNAADSPVRPRRTPLPKLQLLIVMLINMAEPLAGTVIYPFINKFVRETGITNGDEKKTGYYAGIIESVYFLSECLTVVQWGYLSDRFGRRPILVLGPLGLALSVLMFGISTTFWPLVVSRCLQGAFNGNIGVSKSVMAEITDSTNLADAFAYLPFTWSVGVIAGPIIGGYFADPAIRWPDTLGRLAFLRTHRYFIPCAIVAGITFAIFLLALFGLKETLYSLRNRHESRHSRQDSNSTLTEESPLLKNFDTHGFAEPPSTAIVSESSSRASYAEENIQSLSTILRGPIIYTFVSYGLLAFLGMCHWVLLPLMYSTSIPLGGLGLDPYRIGIVLTFFGVISAIVQLFLLAPLVRKFGPKKMFALPFYLMPFYFGMYIVMSLLVRRAGKVDGYVAACIVLQLALQTMDAIAYGSAQMYLIQGIPDKYLGTINGIAQMISSGSRALAPTFASSLYAVSLQKQLAGGYMIFYILIAGAFVGMGISSRLPKVVPTH